LPTTRPTVNHHIAADRHRVTHHRADRTAGTIVDNRVPVGQSGSHGRLLGLHRVVPGNSNRLPTTRSTVNHLDDGGRRRVTHHRARRTASARNLFNDNLPGEGRLQGDRVRGDVRRVVRGVGVRMVRDVLGLGLRVGLSVVRVRVGVPWRVLLVVVVVGFFGRQVVRFLAVLNDVPGLRVLFSRHGTHSIAHLSS
jgi:hypothetical protein